MIYLDHNATTPLHPAVRAVVVEWLDHVGNPSSVHAQGARARAAIRTARRQVAQRVGARPSGVTFTSGATEALSTVIAATAGHIVVSAVEHPAVLEAAAAVCPGLIRVPVDAFGRLEPQAVIAALRPETTLVCVMAVNNETGNRYDTRAVAHRLRTHAPQVRLLVDAAQAVGRGPCTLESTGADWMVISGHKIGGPPGIGALITRPGADPPPPIIRGGGQERGRRGGTENLPAIVGLGAACLIRPDLAHLTRLTQTLEARLLALPDAALNGDPAGRAAGTVNVRFAGLDAQAALLELDLRGVCASSGSACASGSTDPSHVLLAQGLSPQQAFGSIRFSLGEKNTIDDVEKAASIVAQVATLQRN